MQCRAAEPARSSLECLLQRIPFQAEPPEGLPGIREVLLGNLLRLDLQSDLRFELALTKRGGCTLVPCELLDELTRGLGIGKPAFERRPSLGGLREHRPEFRLAPREMRTRRVGLRGALLLDPLERCSRGAKLLFDGIARSDGLKQTRGVLGLALRKLGFGDAQFGLVALVRIAVRRLRVCELLLERRARSRQLIDLSFELRLALRGGRALSRSTLLRDSMRVFSFREPSFQRGPDFGGFRNRRAQLCFALCKMPGRDRRLLGALQTCLLERRLSTL